MRLSLVSVVCVALTACGPNSIPEEVIDLATVARKDAGSKFDLAFAPDFATSMKGCQKHVWTAGAFTVPAATRPLFNAVYVKAAAATPVYLGGMLLKTSDSTFVSGLTMRAENSDPTNFVLDTATDNGAPGYIDQQVWGLTATNGGTMYVSGTGGRVMGRTPASAFVNLATGGATGTMWAAWAPPKGTGVFFGGTNGVLRFFNGSSADSLDRAAGATVYAIWGTDEANYRWWAVGVGGRIWSAKGATLPTEETSPVTTDLRSVWGASSTELYAVGQGGVILRSSGTGMWTVATTNTTTSFNAVAGADGEVYAVGNGGKVLCSADHGVTWDDVVLGPSATQDLIAVGGRAGRVVIVGRGAQIWVK